MSSRLWRRLHAEFGYSGDENISSDAKSMDDAKLGIKKCPIGESTNDLTKQMLRNDAAWRA